jgi:hypothetical protein
VAAAGLARHGSRQRQAISLDTQRSDVSVGLGERLPVAVRLFRGNLLQHLDEASAFLRTHLVDLEGDLFARIHLSTRVPVCGLEA